MKSSEFIQSLSFSSSYSGGNSSPLGGELSSSPMRKRISEETSRKKSSSAAGGDDGVTLFPQDRIASSFFIVDDYGQDEGADANKILLYFYPDSVPMAQRVALHSGCSAVIAVSANFGPPVTTLSLESRAKIAFLTRGVYTFVLTGPEKDGDLTLIRHLTHIYRAFRFLNHSMEAVVQASEGNRDNLLARMAHIGTELNPILRSYHLTTSRTFQPLAVVELPRGGTRLLLFARQLLSAVLDQATFTQNNNRSNDSHPSPHAPSSSESDSESAKSVTSSLGTLLHSSEKSRSGASSNSRTVPSSPTKPTRNDDSERSFSEATTERISPPSPLPNENRFARKPNSSSTYGAAVFYDHAVVCLQMNKAAARFISALLLPKPAPDELRMHSNLHSSSGSSSTSSLNSSSTNVPSPLLDSTYAELTSEVELRHVWAPPDIATNPKPDWDAELIEMALLVFTSGRTSLALLLDIQTSSSSESLQLLRATVDSRLSQLDAQLTKVLRELPNPIHSVQGISCIHQHLQSGENANSIHNSLVYSELTETAKGTEATIDFGDENPFLSTASLVHDSFEEMPDTTQIILRDHHGIYYCKKTMTRETYLHFPPSNPICADRSLEKLEREVRRVLEAEVQAPPPL